MFQDLKIVELASVLAGPLTGTFFSELGAKVIKIENKTTQGDVTRKWKLPAENKDANISAYYSSANYAKQVIFLDLYNLADYERVIEEIKDADVVIANYKTGSAEKLKLDYNSLKHHKSDLIYAELTGFGAKDKRPAFDVVLQAETGFMSMNGEENAAPLKMPVALIDILAAHHMKEAILSAIIVKMKTGSGKHIQISLYESAIASLANQATNWLMAKHVPKRMGSKHPNIAPYGDLFLTKDKRFIVLAAGTDKQFIELAELLEIDTLEFSTNQLRVQHRAKLNELLAKKFIEKSASDWDELLKSNNIPFGLVKSLDEVFKDEAAQSLLLKETIEGVETIRVKTALI